MNKSELVSAISEDTGVSKADTDKVLNAFCELAAKTIGDGGKVQIAGYMTFERTERAARKGRNPQTGEEMDIPAGFGAKITAGSKLKEAAKRS